MSVTIVMYRSYYEQIKMKYLLSSLSEVSEKGKTREFHIEPTAQDTVAKRKPVVFSLKATQALLVSGSLSTSTNMQVQKHRFDPCLCLVVWYICYEY